MEVDPDRLRDAESWLVGIAQDVIDHDCCQGCKFNAAQALDAMGCLDEVLTRINKPDPRSAVPDPTSHDGTSAYRSSLAITLDDGTALRRIDPDG
jgi:hypothetical protein